MWRFLILLVLILQGCSLITVDEIEPGNEGQGSDTEQIQQQEPVTEEQSGVEKQTAFLETIDKIFNLDGALKKSLDASPLYYMALGDSLTRGVGDEKMEYGYTERLSRELEKWPEISLVELDNRGKNGRRSDQLLDLLKLGHYDEELPKADLITMTLGGNDVMRVVKADLFRLNKGMFDSALPGFVENYEKIITEIRLRNAKAPIVLIGFYNPFHIITDEYTPFETIIDEWNAEIARIAEEDTNACFVPIADLFTSNTDLVYHTDFFHPNGNGYDRMTTRIIDTLQACQIEEMSDGRIGFEE